MAADVVYGLLNYAIDLNLHSGRNPQFFFQPFIALELVIELLFVGQLRHTIRQRPLKRSRKPYVCQRRWTQVFADAANLCRDGFNL